MRLSIGLRPLLLLFPIFTAAGATPAVAVSVSPTTVTLRSGQTRTFTAHVSNTANTTVTWSVNGVDGGNATFGTITPAGLYTTPATLPGPPSVTIKAVSAADTTKFATAVVTLQNPLPVLSSIDSYNINTGLSYTLHLKGTGFLPASQVMFDTTLANSVFVSSTQLTVTGLTNDAPGTVYSVTVVNPDPGGATSGAKTVTVVPPVSITVSPTTRTIRAGSTYDFNSSVANNSDKSVTWYVNDVKGGNAALGAIDANGLYQAPVILPANTPTVTLKAVSNADPKASATAVVTLQNAIPVITKLTPASIPRGAATLTVEGKGFATLAKVLVGGVELATTFVSDTKLTATGNVAAAAGGVTAVKVTNPDPGTATSASVALAVTAQKQLVTYADAYRFLEKASWGPTPDAIAHLQEIGTDAWLNEQLAMPASTYPDPASMNDGLGAMQQAFFNNAFHGNDQLRQRVAFSLGQIFVVSGLTASRYHQMVDYQRMLLNNAFGNYHELMRDVTLSPTMGIYLNMVNNDKADPKKNTVPNENFARELLQLFTIGLYELNIDGSRVAPPTPPYSETTVKELAKVFTGFTFAPEPGFLSHWKNDPYFFAPMVPFDEHHDLTPKSVLGSTVSGAGAMQDVEQALSIIFNHHNVGPFVAYRLIQHLVTSNPTPAYVAYVASKFNDNGSGQRGDLKAVVHAIFTHPDFNNAAADQGHLREPVLFSVALLRALNATATTAPSLASRTEAMGQRLFFPPSVFNYYSPGYRLPVVGAVAPEFQILNASTALNRANFVYAAVRNGISSTIKVDLSSLIGLGSDTKLLLDAVSNIFYGGKMTQAMRDSITKAIDLPNNPLDRTTRVRNALYLAATASQYQVER